MCRIFTYSCEQGQKIKHMVFEYLCHLKTNFGHLHEEREA